MRLILEAPHVFVEDLSVASITLAKDQYQTTNMRPKLARYHKHVDETFWGWNDIWLDPEFRSWNIEEYLPAIRCPILCIQGEEDEYGTIAQVEADQGAGAGNRDRDAAELQALAASRPAGSDAGADGRVCGRGSGEEVVRE